MLTLVALAGAPRAPAQAQEPEGERRLADDIVERTRPDGSRDLVVDQTKLLDETPAPQPPPAVLTDADRGRGFVLYRRGPELVFRRSSPAVEERIAGLATAISLGEQRAVQFALYALADLGHVGVSAEPLARRDGKALPGDLLAVRPVRGGLWGNYWDPRYQESAKLIDLPGADTPVIAGESQLFWVNVSVPESAEPGAYQTLLRVQPAHGEAAELPLTVEVLPFRLVPGRWWGVYYYATFHANTPRDFADMKAHGVNALLLCPHDEPILERHGERVVASFPRVDMAMAELKRQGFDRPIALYPRLTSCRVVNLFDRIDGQRIKGTAYYGQPAADYRAEDFPADLKPVLQDLFRQMVAHAQEAGWPPILWYLVDEPNAAATHNAEMEWARLEYPLFAEACPGEKLLCTAYTKAVVDRIGVPLDVRVADLWQIGDDEAARTAERGAQLWGIRWLCQYHTYQFPRHYAGLGLDRLGVHGCTEWTYYGAPTYRPYDQVRSPHGCHYAFTDEAGNLLSTITWEGTREGINDARYVATLRQLLERGRASDRQALQDLAVSAQKALDAILAEVPPITATLPQERLDALRARLVEQILRFVGAGITPEAGG